MHELILASGSPRRIELLGMMGIPFQAVATDVDENFSGPPEEAVLHLAEKKARAAQLQYPQGLILGADTLVYARGQTLGKPVDEDDAYRMLTLLQGTEHMVYSGICLLNSERLWLRYECTRVFFVPLDDGAIRAYIKSGEPFGKAGSYAVQGQGGMFVARIEGSPSNVIGLPMHALRDLLMDAGFFTTCG